MPASDSCIQQLQRRSNSRFGLNGIKWRLVIYTMKYNRVYFTSTILHVKYTKLQNATPNNCLKPRLVLRSVRYVIYDVMSVNGRPNYVCGISTSV